MQTEYRNESSRVPFVLLLLTCVLFSVPVSAAAPDFGEGAVPVERDYPFEGSVRYSFAETYVGADISAWDGEFLPALSVGGTHFWGASDIYVRFPIGTVATGEGNFSPGIETSIHWYPAPLTRDSVRPYIGAGWTVASYNRPDGPDVTKHMFPLKAGVSVRNNGHLLELGLSYLTGGDIRYPQHSVDSNETSTATLTPATDIPQLGVSLAYKYVFDTTLHAAPRYQQEKDEAILLGEAGQLDNWGIIVSPSTVFPVGTGALPPHLVNYPPAVTYELGLSRYVYDYDLSLQTIYRPSSISQSAFDDDVKLTGQSLRVEGLKFMPLDYYGFVPFLGVGIGYEDWTDERSWAGVERQSGWAPSFAFGWEIRPTRKESFYLRQSMRYTATQMAGAPVDAFDVSFIQFVYYVGR